MDGAALKGEPGPQGERGPPGPQGERGPPGPKGQHGSRSAELRVVRGHPAAFCEPDETMLSVYCVSSANEMQSHPFVIPPRGARCIGMMNPIVVITCARLDKHKRY
jgi:hypothetical protein